MSEPFRERVWGANYHTEIRLSEMPPEPGAPTDDPLLALTADVGDEETTGVLDADGVRNLRLALQRYERKAAKR